MPRQPFLRAHPDAKYYINQNCMADRPEMASIIARCILTWSLVDVEMSLILAALLDTRSEAAVAVYLSLPNTQTRINALDRAAATSLTGEDLALLNATIALYKTSNSDRNDLAHGIFGVVSNEPDQLIWCPSAKFAAWMTRANQSAWNLEFDPDPHAPLRNEMFIYTKTDLETIFSQFSFVFDVVSRMHMALSPIQGSKDFGRQWLLAQPKIQVELNRAGQ